MKDPHNYALTLAMLWWIGALPFILLAIAPVRDFAEFSENKPEWYNFIRWCKVGLLIAAIVLILIGAGYFDRGIGRVAFHQRQ